MKNNNKNAAERYVVVFQSLVLIDELNEWLADSAGWLTRWRTSDWQMFISNMDFMAFQQKSHYKIDKASTDMRHL